MSSVLMTSTMKSDPATPPIRFRSACGTLVSAAMVCVVGGSTEGRRAGAAPATVALAACGAMVPAAPATATPVRNLRRSTLGPESFVPRTLRVMARSLDGIFGGDSRFATRARSPTLLHGNLSHQGLPRQSRLHAPGPEKGTFSILKRQKEGRQPFQRQEISVRTKV